MCGINKFINFKQKFIKFLCLKIEIYILTWWKLEKFLIMYVVVHNLKNKRFYNNGNFTKISQNVNQNHDINRASISISLSSSRK